MRTTELEDWLRDASACKLLCVDETGYPMAVPLVYEYHGGGFSLMAREPAAWAQHVLARPRVALLIEDESRRVLVQGWAAPEDEAAALRRLFGHGERTDTGAHEPALAAPNAAHTPRSPHSGPVAAHWFFIRPTRVLAWHGAGWASVTSEALHGKRHPPVA
jgi:hypothetical protein